MSNETSEPEVSTAPVSVHAEPISVAPPNLVLPSTPSASGSSIAALVLSILSWVGIPIVLAIVALVYANKAEKEIAASNGSVAGGSFVLASKIVAWVNIGVYTAFVIPAFAAMFFVMILGAMGN